MSFLAGVIYGTILTLIIMAVVFTIIYLKYKDNINSITTSLDKIEKILDKGIIGKILG